MGYPMSKGSIRDGVLICHWHHWEFDLKTGGCLLTSGDDLKAFPVEVRDDGYAWVGIPPGEKEEARLRLVARGKRALEQGLKDRSSFLIAKAVAALRQTGATPTGNHPTGPLLRRAQNQRRLVVGRRHPNPRGEHVGRHRRGRSKPLSRPRLDPDFAAHLRLVAPPALSPFPAPMTTKIWPPSSAGFALLSISGTTARPSASCSPCTTATAARKPLADFVFTAATDFYFTGDGHALDFANKMFEALDYVEWVGAHEILRPIAVDLVSRTRHEETSRWADSLPVLENIFTRLDEIWDDNQRNEATLDVLRVHPSHARRRL